MAKVHYRLKKQRNQDGTQLIVLIYNYGYKRFQYSVGETIAQEDWNGKTWRARKSHPYHKALNTYLDRLAIEAKNAYLDIKASGKPVTNAALRERMDIFTGRAADPEKINFLTWSKQIAKEKGSAPYKNLVTNLSSYLKRKRRSADFEEINLVWFKEFQRYLSERDLSANYINRLGKAFKTTWKEAILAGHAKDRSLLDAELTTAAKSGSAVYLTAEEIKTLISTKYSTERLSKARDLLVFACLTGLRYVDWKAVNLHSCPVQQVGSFEFMQIVQSKTKVVFHIPLLHPARAILDRYDGQLPVISDQKAREYAREAAQEAGINGKVTISKQFTGRISVNHYEKWERIGTHTGRRSFTSLLRSAGMPEHLVTLLKGGQDKSLNSQYDQRPFEALALDLLPYLEKIEENIMPDYTGPMYI